MLECRWCKREFIPPVDASKWGFGVEYMVFCSSRCYEGYGYNLMLAAGEVTTLEKQARLLERIRDAQQAIFELDRRTNESA